MIGVMVSITIWYRRSRTEVIVKFVLSAKIPVAY